MAHELLNVFKAAFPRPTFERFAGLLVVAIISTAPER